MNKGNERILAILAALRKLPRWALILITVGVIVVLGIAMFLLLPQQPTSQGDSSYLNSTGLAFSVFLRMGVIILLIVGLAIILRRWKTKSFTDQEKQISVLETVHLSPHRTLYMIKVEGQKFLIGATDQNISNLGPIAVSDQASEFISKESGKDFSEILQRTRSSSENYQL